MHPVLELGSCSFDSRFSGEPGIAGTAGITQVNNTFPQHKDVLIESNIQALWCKRQSRRVSLGPRERYVRSNAVPRKASEQVPLFVWVTQISDMVKYMI